MTMEVYFFFFRREGVTEDDEDDDDGVDAEAHTEDDDDVDGNASFLGGQMWLDRRDPTRPAAWLTAPCCCAPGPGRAAGQEPMA